MALPRGARVRAPEVVRLLAELYPDAQCALHHENPFQLLVATILSAQCTDERVNMVTPELFARYPTPADLAHARPDDVEEIIRSTGFFRAKTRSLIGMAQALEDRFGGEVPTELDDLVTVPGVGRKTANVVRSVAFDLPGLPVDTHVTRLARRLGLTNETDPVKIERELDSVVPAPERGKLSLRLIEHGRRVCDARRPRCEECGLAPICPSAGRVGADRRNGRARDQGAGPSSKRAARSTDRRAASNARSTAKSSAATAESGESP
jgi:endonuclease-3